MAADRGGMDGNSLIASNQGGMSGCRATMHQDTREEPGGGRLRRDPYEAEEERRAHHPLIQLMTVSSVLTLSPLGSQNGGDPSIHGAGTWLSIFMASMIRSGSPVLTHPSRGSSPPGRHGRGDIAGFGRPGRFGFEVLPALGFRHARQHFLERFKRHFLQAVVDANVVRFTAVGRATDPGYDDMVVLAMHRDIEFSRSEVQIVRYGRAFGSAGSSGSGWRSPCSRASKKSPGNGRKEGEGQLIFRGRRASGHVLLQLFEFLASNRSAGRPLDRLFVADGAGHDALYQEGPGARP